MDTPQGVNARLRSLPPVHRLVELAAAETELARWSVLRAARDTLDTTRALLTEDSAADVPDVDSLVEQTRRRARQLETEFPRRVINATGVVLHTNLGRAPLAPAALEQVARASGGYSNLEFDLEGGRRGSRLAGISELLCAASGAEAALVVNNAAAALLLAVDALAAGREVVLSRGELVEIGGSFRMPDILGVSRARLREIGTTNRTHLDDYRDAAGPDTGLLLKVHRSNFRVEGFTAEVPLAQLSRLGRELDIPVVEDRGSGTFVDLQPHGVPEAAAWEGLRAGADVVVFSGDKLLGGPQAGIALGRGDLIGRMRRSPLARALRVDKMTLAALDWTLRALLEGREREIPVLGMLLADPDDLAERAEALAKRLADAGWSEARSHRGPSPVGGGSLPDVELPGAQVRLELGGRAAGELADTLRRLPVPVLVRVHSGAVCVDPRTLSDADADALVAAMSRLR